MQKITSDVDELTGNPEFRENVDKLIQGLRNLVSSTQLLQQQLEYDRAFKNLASEIAKIQLEESIAPNQQKPAPIVQPDINQPHSQP